MSGPGFSDLLYLALGFAAIFLPLGLVAVMVMVTNGFGSAKEK
jgi:hypothetical protein